MPRRRIEPDRHVEFLAILSKDGKLDKKLEPDLDDALLLDMHKAMLRGRRFDERRLRLQRQGRIGTFAPNIGQEAAQIGAAAALRDDDWLVPSFRETVAMLWRGIPMDGILLFDAGYNEGAAIPENQFTLPNAVPVATQIPHAVGIAYAMKLRKEDRVVMAAFGDGATSQGDFHEGMNFASVLQTPTVFLCQNNQWAISVPRDRQTSSKTLAEKALAYDMPGLQVDGNDVLAVYAASREAVDRARAGDGPTMIECVTYRMSVHTTADDPSRYREEEEVESWAGRDPIDRFQRYLERKKLLDRDEVEELEEAIKAEIDQAWQAVEKEAKKLGDPLVMFDHLYAEAPRYLREQRESLRAELKQKER